MSKEAVTPAVQGGAWTTQHEYYHRTARSLLRQAKSLCTAYISRESNMAPEVQDAEPTVDDSHIPNLANHLTGDDAEQVETLCLASQIFACMAVDSFVNSYGVLGLGERYYKRHLEWLSVDQRLISIFAVLMNKLVDPDDDISTTVRQMFESRDRLTFPKPREEIWGEALILADFAEQLGQAEQGIHGMYQFFRQFKHFDDNAVPDRLAAEPN